MTALVVASLACAAWFYLLLFRGGFWRAAERDDAVEVAPPVAWPHVIAVVPARNEAAVIAASVASLMAKLHCESLAERALIPAFIFFFRLLYPFAWVNRPERAAAAAAGGCMLVRRDALRAAGGIASIRGELIDDCALARILKMQGPIWLGLTEPARSLRAFRSPP